MSTDRNFACSGVLRISLVTLTSVVVQRPEVSPSVEDTLEKFQCGPIVRYSIATKMSIEDMHACCGMRSSPPKQFKCSKFKSRCGKAREWKTSQSWGPALRRD